MLTRLHTPASPDEAVELLRGRGPDEVRIIAGGTEIMPRVNAGTEPAQELLSLRRATLDGIEVRHGRAVLGAAATLHDLAAHPDLAVLHPAVRSIAAPPVRSLATVGGNLFAPAPYGDLAVCLLALEAEIDVLGPEGGRTAPVEEVVGRGLDPGELLTTVRFTVPDAGRWRYRKAARRRLNSGSIVTVAAVHPSEGGGARLAVGGIAERPMRVPAAEAALQSTPWDEEAVAGAAEAALSALTPRTDAYASAWYRARVLPVHLRRALLGP
jgi:CO/xanthine dehydrogenase FAD-binding subunit